MDLKKKRKNSERGAMSIMEATFVFPIMFIIVLMMILLGEAYYQQARVGFEVAHAAISGAARCENPMLEYIQKNGNSVPTAVNATKVMPYRYIIPAKAKEIATGVENDLEEKINSMKPLAFRGMAPREVDVNAEAQINVLVSSLTVDCTFYIQMPIRMIFSKENIKIPYSIRTKAPIADPSEFVRNVSTTQDLLERSKGATEIFSKIGEKLRELKRFTD